MRSLRVGVVGYGSMGRNHARVLRELECVELVGVADPIDLVTIPGNFLSAEALLAEGLDYGVIAVPTRLHEEVAALFAEAGVPALIEKPLASDLQAAERIADMFEVRGVLGAVGHVERFNPALVQARKRIAQGDLGSILQISTRRQGPYPQRITDVGVVMDLGTHDFDLTSWISGVKYGQVSARTGHRSGGKHEDLVAVTGQLTDGTVTNHLVNWLSPFKERVVIVMGERGTFVADTLLADLTHYANGSVPTEWSELARFRGVSEGDVVRFAIPKPEPLRTEHIQMCNAVLGQSADLVTLRNGCETVRVAEAVLRSAANSVPETLAGG